MDLTLGKIDKREGERANEPDIRHDDSTLRNQIPLVDIILGAEVRKAHWGDRMPSERFLDECLDVGKFLAIIEGGEFVRAEDAVDFFLRFGLHFRV